MTPYLVRWVYLGTLAVVALGELFSLLWVWALAEWIGAAMWLAAPVLLGVGLVVVLAVRIACERTLAKLGKWSRNAPTT
ncbi:hypothetical protein [Actinomadura rupiterrae]|uniref:hypothetical protein n=1 Tax=Actinomadura rupiterrae TaxID=559627 RepID=UPI0020A44165|nr:hypothetical protein [Actinomadura rupiterrae]MCP2340592.1 hypothetical protein [Actinomadura rupiterrae]